MERALMSLLNPVTGLIWLNFRLTASGATLRPVIAAQARTEPAKSAARMGQTMSIESMIFAFVKFQKDRLSAKTAV